MFSPVEPYSGDNGPRQPTPQGTSNRTLIGTLPPATPTGFPGWLFVISTSTAMDPGPSTLAKEKDPWTPPNSNGPTIYLCGTLEDHRVANSSTAVPPLNLDGVRAMAAPINLDSDGVYWDIGLCQPAQVTQRCDTFN